MIQNWSFFVGFVLTAVALSYYALFLTPRQWKEVNQPQDEFSSLRKYILLVLIFAIVTLVPSASYQLMVALGHENEVFRNLIAVISRVNIVANLVLLHLIFTYRVKK